MKFLIPVFIGFIVFNGNAQGLSGSDTTRVQAEQEVIPPFNLQLVQAVKLNIGKKVGTGECWDLIQVVLDNNRAIWERTEKFGIKLNPTKESLKPGDIIMFKKAVFKGNMENGGEYTISMYNHYAFIIVVKGEELVIAHQNTDEFGKKVGLSTIHLKDLKKGTLSYFRPVGP